jgi:hypothetical protein
MTLNVCPADTVHAPLERVWELLMLPAGYGRFWDLTIERVEPDGPAAAGQRFVGWSRALCRRWRVEAEILDVNPQDHHILFRMMLPFGLVSLNRIACVPIDEHQCTVRYG